MNGVHELRSTRKCSFIDDNWSTEGLQKFPSTYLKTRHLECAEIAKLESSVFFLENQNCPFDAEFDLPLLYKEQSSGQMQKAIQKNFNVVPEPNFVPWMMM
jgi:hypothetical protein